jgi:hypothetical protein
MQFFRKLIQHKKLTGFLLFGLLLRSLIATGFMFDNSPADGSLFSVIICDGPAGINAIAGLSEQPQQHEHHHEHDSDEHDHAAQDHGFSACGFWSASSQTVLTDVIFFDVADTSLADEVVVYQRLFIPRFSNNTRLARAPPSLS